MAKVSLVLDTRKQPDDAGTYPLYLRISHRSKEALVSLGIRLRERDWNAESQTVRKRHGDRHQLNEYLARRRGEAEAIVLDFITSGREPEAAAVKERFLMEGEPETRFDFLAYCRARLALIEADGRVSTYRNHRTAVEKLEAFQRRRTGRKVLTGSDLTPAFLEAFMTFLRSEYDNATNTIHKNLRAIRSMLYAAIRDGHISQSDNPFFHITLRREKTTKVKLTRKEIAALEAAEMEGAAEDVRHAFLFGLYMMGMRWSDVCMLRWPAIEGEPGSEMLSYRMQKTGTPKQLRVTEAAARHLAPYRSRQQRRAWVFPFLDAYGKVEGEALRRAVMSQTTLANEQLKEIARAAEITKNLTTHVARHSFATVAVESGWSVREIQQALGHRDVRETQGYLRELLDRDLEEKHDDLF